MKQQIIELKKKLLLVELPEGATDIEISVLGDIMYRHKLGLDILWQSNGSEVKNLVGKLTDITEEQFAVFTPYAPEIVGYLDYGDNGNISFNTAEESFFSKLEADGIYFENPLDEEKKAYFLKGSENTWDSADLKRWQEAQEKVWNRNNTFLFEII
ncbi:MAG TPA: hypothetical protein VIQ00_11435 [Chitinophagaceae bacterium]